MVRRIEGTGYGRERYGELFFSERLKNGCYLKRVAGDEDVVEDTLELVRVIGIDSVVGIARDKSQLMLHALLAVVSVAVTAQLRVIWTKLTQRHQSINS